VAEPIPLPTPAQTATLRALLVPLARVSALLFVLGIIFAVDAFTRAIFGTLEGGVGWIPFVGRLVAQPIHRIEQKVSNYLGGLESHIDVSMGGYIHALATGVGQLASGEAEAGWATWLIAKVVHATRVAVDALPSTGTVTGKITKVYKITKTYPRYVTNVYKIAAHAAPGALVGTVRAIAGTLDDVVTWDIPRLWKRTKALERRVDDVTRRIRGARTVIGASVFAGLLVAALAKLGLGWVRCSNVRKLGRRACGMDASQIEGLLLDTIAIVGTVSLIEFIRDAQAIEAVALDALGGFIREFPQV
jgi:hypothetical protein